MEIKKLTGIVLLSLFAICTMSCSKEETEKTEEKKGIAIKSITATSKIDLSGREKWLFRIGYGNPNCVYYNYTLNKNTLYATSDKDNVYYFDKRFSEGDKIGAGSYIAVYFQDKRYYRSTSMKSNSPESPDIIDQSTEEKFMIADRLAARYVGVVSENISDINFTHANSLVEFEINGIDNQAKVYLYDFSFALTIPLKEGNTYKAIATLNAGISVKIGEVYYNASVVDKPKPATHYKVKAHFDKDKKQLVIDNVENIEWNI